jgi:hypothetical protein
MARLLSVNVGLPCDIAWQEKTVHTAEDAVAILAAIVTVKVAR